MLSVVHRIGNVFYGVSDGLNRFIRGALQFFLAGTDHHAHNCASKHAQADPTHKMIVFHIITLHYYARNAENPIAKYYPFRYNVKDKGVFF